MKVLKAADLFAGAGGMSTGLMAAAMGFPKDYQFTGTKTEHVKQIGNAVSVKVAQALCFAAIDNVKSDKARKAQIAADRHSRLAWGVLFTGAQKDARPMLLGEGWHETAKNRPEAFAGETRRTLLFKTRAQARGWCFGQYKRYEGRTDCCASWRFRPVKVRETVTPCR